MAKETPNQRVKKAIDWLIENGYASSQRIIAEKMMYSPSTLSLILNGKINVKERFVRTLCGISKNHLNEDWIFTGEGDMVSDVDMLKKEYCNPSRMTFEDIIVFRMALEQTIADACAEFTKKIGIKINTINCTNSTSVEYDEDDTKKEMVAYDINVPLEIPSLGSNAKFEDYNVYGSGKPDFVQIDPVTREAYELLKKFNGEE